MPEQKAGRDNLRRIKGIGPKTEKALNGLGIYRFRQIAQLTPEEVARLNEQLGSKERIEREEWIEQAKLLIQT